MSDFELSEERIVRITDRVAYGIAARMDSQVAPRQIERVLHDLELALAQRLTEGLMRAFYG